MRSVVLSKDGKLSISTSHEQPTPKPNHVLVRVRAFAVNQQDLKPTDEDRATGCECVGVVEDCGDVNGLRVGATVAVIGAAGGVWRDHVLVPARNVIPLRVAPLVPAMPLDAATWAKLASIPSTFLTAFLICDTLDLRRQDRLLIRGGTSSVGLAVSSVAKAIGAVVASTTRDPTKAPNLSDNGADFVILEREGGIADDVRMMFPARDLFNSADDLSSATPADTTGADKIVDLIGPTTLIDSLRALKSPGGICCLAGTLGGPSTGSVQFDPLVHLSSGQYLTRCDLKQVDLSRAPLQEIVDRVLEKSEFKLNLDRAFVMDDVAKMGEFVAAGSARGKIVVVVNDEMPS
ncbi:hypothetical protein DFJ77DRAFT_454948 [Powellomyces hirtus]|nr:hypothetical protein DFJ77DRAFT_454948 [Powellomyces hirtus]